MFFLLNYEAVEGLGLLPELVSSVDESKMLLLTATFLRQQPSAWEERLRLSKPGGGVIILST